MRIVTWNCRGALRNKFEQLNKFDADIYIVQECENPELSGNCRYKAWASNCLWIGDNKHKGLAVFAKPQYDLNKLCWSNIYYESLLQPPFQNHEVKHFLPCRVNDSFIILAVWTHKNNSEYFRYIGQFWKYMQINAKYFNNIIIIGDFNSSSNWDEWDCWWRHSNVVNQLRSLHIESQYHQFYHEEQGKESHPTFFQNRKGNPHFYHIDYCFASKEFSTKLNSVEVRQYDEWKTYSDHMPMIVEYDI